MLLFFYTLALNKCIDGLKLHMQFKNGCKNKTFMYGL